MTATSTTGAVNAKKKSIVEAKLQIKFPQEIEQLYLLYNGGSPERYTFYDEEDDGYVVQKFLSIKNDKNHKDTIEYCIEDFRNDGVFPNWLIPVAYDPGGNYYCISVDKEDFGSVYFWSHDYEVGENIEEYIVYLAESIIEFVEKMQ